MTIEARVSDEAWGRYLVAVDRAQGGDPHELLEVFLTSEDLIRAAVAKQRKQAADERAKVREISR